MKLDILKGNMYQRKEHDLKLWCCGNHKKVIINLMKISQGHELVNKYFSFILEFGSTNQTLSPSWHLPPLDSCEYADNFPHVNLQHMACGRG